MEVEKCIYKMSSQISNLLPLSSKFILICWLCDNEGGICKYFYFVIWNNVKALP